jgi:hypothetical protein
MQSHASEIQAILARELEGHRRQVTLVHAGLLTVAPRPQGIAAGAQALRSRLEPQAFTMPRPGAVSATA